MDNKTALKVLGIMKFECIGSDDLDIQRVLTLDDSEEKLREIKRKKARLMAIEKRIGVWMMDKDDAMLLGALGALLRILRGRIRSLDDQGKLTEEILIARAMQEFWMVVDELL